MLRLAIRPQHISDLLNHRQSFLIQSLSRSLFESRWTKMEGRKDQSNGDFGQEPFRLRHIRYKEKVAGKLPVPGVIELSVVGTGAHGTPKSLVVDMNHFKYLFNCGEGTQRIAAEHKMKLSRVEQIFITHASWANIGGLMGFCLTAESSGVEEIQMHGPPQCDSLVTSARSFAQLHSLKIQKHEVSELTHIDTAMTVEYAPFYSSSSPPNITARVPPPPSYPGLLEEEDGATAADKDCDEPTEKRKRLDESVVYSNVDRSVAVAYICTPHPKPRAISLEKCVDHGVPAGPLMGELKDGKTVTLSCGKQVQPDDVLESAVPNNPFIVVECPTEDYLESLLANPQLNRYQTTASTPLSPCLVIHFTPQHICVHSQYQDWMNRFGRDVEHLIVNESCSPLSLLSVYEIQAKLNLIHNDIYPLLPAQRLNEQSLPHQTDDEQVNHESIGAGLKITYGETNLSYILRAKVSHVFNREKCLRIDNSVSISEVLGDETCTAALDSLKQELASLLPKADDKMGQYPEILFLGTGSTMPNKVRNVSAIWVNTSAEDSILLDCGENTYGQLFRFYGNKTQTMLSRLRAVYISHLHADHHLGLVGLALERWLYLKSTGAQFTPLTVLSPGNVRAWYTSIHCDLVPMLHITRVIPLDRLYSENREQSTTFYEQVLSLLHLKEIQVVRALHRQWPHSISMTHSDGWKLAYSGDTMPCAAFVQAGIDSDILIHEATMEDTLEEEAKQRRHSTTSQAIDIGRQMKAKFILLTHFSQRYAKVPLFNDNFAGNVGIAFDNMRVRPRDLPILSKFTSALKAMFVEEYTDMEKKTEKKSRIKKEKKAKLAKLSS